MRKMVTQVSFWRRTALLATLVLIAYAAGAGAQANNAQRAAADTAVISELQNRVTPFFDGMAAATASQGKEDALVKLLEGSRLALPENAERRQSLVARMERFDQNYGKYRSAELIESRRAGEDLVLLTYLYKGLDFPVVWHFAFYRNFRSGVTTPGGSWVVASVSFDTDLHELAR